MSGYAPRGCSRLPEDTAPARRGLPARAGPLNAAPGTVVQTRKSVTILTTTKGTQWISASFRHDWRRATARARTVGLTFRDLRDVGGSLDTQAPRRDARLAESAMRKAQAQDRGTKIPGRAPDCPGGNDATSLKRIGSGGGT
jgi:hypothetical protein